MKLAVNLLPLFFTMPALLIPSVSAGGFCPRDDDKRYDDVPVVITNRARKPNPNEEFIVNALYVKFSPEERNRVMKFTAGRGKRSKSFYDITWEMEEDNHRKQVVKFTIDRTGAEMLYAVKYCSKGEFYGIRGTDDDGQSGTNDDYTMTKDMEKFVRNSKYFSKGSNMLISIHGITVDAMSQIKNCDEFNQKYSNRTKYFAVPVIWTTEKNFLGFCTDKNENAPAAADVFANKLWPILEKSTFPMSLMSHSLGNYVLSMFAQYIGESPYKSNNQPFEEIFMVAPAIRDNMFNNETNMEYDSYFTRATSYFTSNSGGDDERYEVDQANNGIYIANLAKNGVHVLWTNLDRAMLAYKLHATLRGLKWLLGGFTGCNKYAPLGSRGEEAKEKLAPSLKDKVKFHEIKYPGRSDKFMNHGYQFGPEAVEIYEEFNI